MNINKENISCVILSGGEGKRFNSQDKGLIEFNGKPLIEHVTNAVKAQVNDLVISANRNFDIYKKYSEIVVKDESYGSHGPLSGIASAIKHCEHEWILVVPCDMPLLPGNLVKDMKQAINNELLCIVETSGRLQLVLLMHISLLPGIKQALTQKQYQLIKWVKSQQHVIVNFQDESLFNNINSMEQLSQI